MGNGKKIFKMKALHRFTHRDGMDLEVGDLLDLDGTKIFYISHVESETVFHAMGWRWWHRVIFWNPCNDIEDLYFDGH